jgi:ribulose-phosphate 3-epimerase
MHKVEIVPSILSADFGNLNKALKAIEQAGCKRLQLDVMDGCFVPNISFGQPVIASLRKLTKLHFEVQLMIEAPERYIEDFHKAGSDSIFIHREACEDYKTVLRKIKDLGMEAGIAINPKTPLSAIEDVIDEIDMLLVMTVEPGFGGQHFIPGIEKKVGEAATLLQKKGLFIPIEVDGGINMQTAPLAVKAGAQRLVVGNAIFAGVDPVKNIGDIRKSVEDRT